jgi:hypothetical protein
LCVHLNEVLKVKRILAELALQQQHWLLLLKMFPLPKITVL